MTSTGLTEQEKESLLKWFLTHCHIGCSPDNEYAVMFSGAEEPLVLDEFEKPIADLIIKAMDNLRNSVWGF